LPIIGAKWGSGPLTSIKRVTNECFNVERKVEKTEEKPWGKAGKEGKKDLKGWGSSSALGNLPPLAYASESFCRFYRK